MRVVPTMRSTGARRMRIARTASRKKGTNPARGSTPWNPTMLASPMHPRAIVPIAPAMRGSTEVSSELTCRKAWTIRIEVERRTAGYATRNAARTAARIVIPIDPGYTGTSAKAIGRPPANDALA